MDLGVEIDDDWYSVGNIEYEVLDDLRGDIQQFFLKKQLSVMLNPLERKEL